LARYRFSIEVCEISSTISIPPFSVAPAASGAGRVGDDEAAADRDSP
jgi:hypothetical protein